MKTVLLGAVLAPLCSLAAQSIPRATGIFCSCPPTSSFSSSFVAAVAAKPFVDGFLVRVAWADLEPSPGVFDWSLLDAQIQQCQSAGKRVALGVVQGSGTPSWLASQGAAMVHYQFAGNPRSIALAWDPVYLQRWQQFVAALGARYQNEATIGLVHVTHATHNGFEMQLPQGEQAQYASLGYTDALYASSWATVIDAYAAAFPNHALDCDVHPIFGSDAVAQQVLAHAATRAPGRFGAFGGWWSVHNAQNAYPGMQALFEATAPVSFAAAQNVGSWVTTPSRYGGDLAVYASAYELALATGIRYLEVWNADLLDPSLAPLLTSVQARVLAPGWYQHYPDTATPRAVELTVDGGLAAGGTVDFAVTGAAPGDLVWLAYGTQRGDAFVPGVGDVFVAPLASTVSLATAVADGSGSAGFTIGLPTIAGDATVQVAAIGSVSISTSNGLEVRW